MKDTLMYRTYEAADLVRESGEYLIEKQVRESKQTK